MAEIDYGIKAVETKYAGTVFRSRLEARWAAFFDVVGWPWVYEPFDLDGWFPDFLLKPVVKTRPPVLVEIKPITEFCKDTADRIEKSLVKSNNKFEPLLLGLTPLFEEDEQYSYAPDETSSVGWLAEHSLEIESIAVGGFSWEAAPLRIVTPTQECYDLALDWSEPFRTSGGQYYEYEDIPKTVLADFCHPQGSYEHRITQIYDGSYGGLNSFVCKHYWGKACDKVKYVTKEKTNA